MRILIIEDEVIAATVLQRFMGEIRDDFHTEAVLQTVEESVKWLDSNPMPDLVFMDIHLADGSSFGIFDNTKIECPIIFTTAYNEYALEAFEVNSIDYLLKPINKARLEKAINKFDNISSRRDNTEIINKLAESLQIRQNRHKTHFLVPCKDKLLPVSINDIAYFYADLKIAKAVTGDGRSYSIDYSLEELMKHLDPDRFFRVNRQYIISHKAIDDLSVWFTGKLAVNLKIPVEERIIVSKARVSDFKDWFTHEIP